MPFYHQLRVRESDSAALREKKKRTALRLQRLKAALAEHVQNSNWRMATKQSIRIATWNLREFGSGKYEGRDIEALHYIAEIISHFDIVALQEVRGDLQEFNNLLRILGPDWDYLGTDVTDGSPGNGERMIFVYDKRSIRFRNIVGELTLEEGQKIRAAFGERIKLEHAGMKVVLPPRSRSLSGVYDARLRTVSKGKKLADDLEIPLPEGTMLELPPGSSIVLTKNTLVDSPGRGDAEVEIPDEISGENWRLRLPENSFDDSLKQFARTPFLISFQAGWLKINLCTVHIYYGSDSSAEMEQRRSEIFQLSKALADKAKKEFKYDGSSFLGVLGDFNIIGKGHPTMEALESNGFVIPDQLKAIPGSNVARDKAYDQIAFWEPNQDRGILSLDILAANVFDFFEHVFTDEDEAIYREETGNGMEANTRYSNWRTYKMSDHLPMWIEIRTDFSEDYLEAIEPEQEKLINKQLDGGLDEA